MEARNVQVKVLQLKTTKIGKKSGMSMPEAQRKRGKEAAKTSKLNI